MSQKLSPGQLKELEECFNLFDSDKSGSICADELQKVFESLDIKINDEEIHQVMKLMDRDGSGCIDFKEFADVMADQFFRKPTLEELEAVFDYFDRDSSGHLTEEELLLVMSRFKGNIKKSDVQKMIQSVDKDGDNMINKKEFINLILNNYD